jgi:NAD(P)H dehydrogenase (quinone)
MRVLIIIAHPNPKSFNHAILKEFKRGLKDGGHTFEVIDLYAIKFNPCIKIEDLVQFKGGQMPQDVLDQQEKLNAAEGLVLIFPRWDWSYPAILEGWIQRIFSYGYSYRISNEGIEGLMKTNQALLIDTTGTQEEYYTSSGLNDAFNKIINTTLRDWSGIPKVDHVTFYGPLNTIDAKIRKKYLDTAYRLGKGF